MERWNEHPIAKWSAVTGLAALLAGGAWSGVWFLKDLRAKLDDIDTRIEVLETEHKQLLEAIGRSEANVREILGRHEGRHENR